ncbi:hypothetical protein [Streptomyces yangpuensis]|uniref:hypothetical protein n=1 Tax=Streptomyces yangpuensis TaxID=1648182 RepID=UPI003810635A
MKLSQSARPLVSLATLQSGASQPAVVVDFIKFSGDPTAGDLVAASLPNHRVLRADPVADLSASSGWTPLSALAAEYATLLSGLDDRPSMLVGYCSAAPLALLIAEQLTKQGIETPVFLVAPGFPDRQHVLDDLAEIRGTMGVPATPNPAPLPDGTAEAMTHLGSLLDSDLAMAARSNGLSEAEAAVLTEELGARYGAWLSYLLSAADASAQRMPADLRILSIPDSWSAPAEGWPATAQIHTSSIDRDDFLTSIETAEAVAVQLADLL